MAIITQGRIEQWNNEPIHIFEPDVLYTDGKKFDAIFNPSICKDDNGTLWVSARAVINDLERIEKAEKRKPSRYHNYLLLGKVDEDTLETSGWKLIEPADEYPSFFWGIEDVRLFWREDGMHGIGVTFNHENIGEDSWRIQQSEILIDYDKGTFSLVSDYTSPYNTNEKNWSPPVNATRYFDLAYSNTQTLIYEDEDVIVDGELDSALQLHNGTQLLPVDKYYLQLSHVPGMIDGERVYANFAVMRNRHGITTDISQLFIWRKRKHQSIEFVSGIAMTKKGVLLSMGIQDNECAFAYLKPEMLKWRPYEPGSQFYRWRWETK